MGDTMHSDRVAYPNDYGPPDHDPRGRLGSVGARVRAVHVADSYTSLLPGAEGKVVLIDSMGNRHVKWDDGRTLALVPGIDRWEVI